MWPFKKKEQANHEKPKVTLQDMWRGPLDDLAKWKKPGDTFEYMGTTMSVVKTSRLKSSDYYTAGMLLPMVYREPCIECMYFDKRGVLRTAEFEWQIAEAIMNADKKANT